jgi:gas vesicle protein
MTRNGWQKTTSIFLIGLGVGAGLGVLFALKSGKETRDEIVGAVKDGADGVLAQGNKLGRFAQKTFEDAKEQVKEAAEAVGQAYREAKTTSS